MNADDFRELALSLPESVEQSHMKHPDFRVGNKVFASLGPDESWGMVKLTPAQQAVLVKADAGTYQPAAGAWGCHGYTKITLESADPVTVRQALIDAWCNTAPAKLRKLHDVR
jgi:hypothetical protein